MTIIYTKCIYFLIKYNDSKQVVFLKDQKRETERREAKRERDLVSRRSVEFSENRLD